MPIRYIIWSFLLAQGLIFQCVQAQAIYSITAPKDSVPDGTIQVTVREGDYVYMAGSSSDECGQAGFVSKVSLATKEIVWSSAVSNKEVISIYSLKIIGNDIYSISDNVTNHSTAVIKLNKGTGELLWTTQVDAITRSTPYPRQAVFDYNDSQILVSQAFKVLLLDKQTGAFQNRYDLPSEYYCIDTGAPNEMIVNSKSKLFKAINFDFNNMSQIVDVASSTCNNCIGQILSIKNISADTTLLIGGTYFGESLVWLVNPNSGQVYWKMPNDPTYVYLYFQISDYKIKNDTIYFAWAGGGIAPEQQFVAMKVSLATGSQYWTKLYSLQRPNNNSLKQASSTLIEVDDAGDVYLGGVTGNNGVTSGAYFGTMKLSGQTGDLLWQRTVGNDQLSWDSYISVKGVFLYNQKLTIAGSIPLTGEYLSAGSMMTMFDTNPSTGALGGSKNYFGKNVGQDSVVKMQRYKDGLLMIEKRGRFAAVTRLDKNGFPSWRTFLKDSLDFVTTPVSIAVTEKKDRIAVLAESVGYNRNGYGMVPRKDRSQFFVLDSLGKLVNKRTIGGGVERSELYCDGTYFYTATDSSLSDATTIFQKMTDQGIVYHRKFNRSLLIDRFHESRLFEILPGKLFLAGYEYSSVIDKTTGNLTSVTGISVPKPINNVLILNDTIFTSSKYYSPDYTDVWYPMGCLAGPNRTLAWSQMTNTNTFATYDKVVAGEPGYLYAMGKNLNHEFLIRKIRTKTGAIIWDYKITNSPNPRGYDILFDKINKRIIAVGHVFNSGSEYVFKVILSTTGKELWLQNNNSEMGIATSIIATSNGQILIGGATSSQKNCNSPSLIQENMPGVKIPLNWLTASDGLRNQVRIKWASDLSNVYFQVYRGTTSDQTLATPISNWIASKMYNDTEATIPNQFYYFIKVATDTLEAPMESPLSDDGYIAINPPTISATDGISSNKITISWNKPEGSNFYHLYRGESNDTTALTPIGNWVNQVSYNDPAIWAGKDFYYFVKAAVNGTGAKPSYFSKPDPGYSTLNRPTITSITHGGANIEVDIEWGQVSGANAYKVYRSETPDSTAALSISDWILPTSYTDDPPKKGTDYFYFIRAAVNSDGFRPSYLSVFSVGTITAIEKAKQIKVYPNPTHGIVFISIDSNQEPQLLLTDSKGTVISAPKIDLSDNTINLKDLANGIYFLRVSGLDKTEWLKLVKE